MKYLAQRVGVFVDVGNMYHSGKHLYNANVNFANILKHASAGRPIIRAIAYVVKADSPKEADFFEALTKAGYEIKSKDIQIFAGGQKKGDWDVGIAMDAIKVSDRLDTIVLVSGDGDYVPLVTYLQENKGCLVEVIAFGRSASKTLVEAADGFTDMDENNEKFIIKNYKK